MYLEEILWKLKYFLYYQRFIRQPDFTFSLVTERKTIKEKNNHATPMFIFEHKQLHSTVMIILV